MKHITGFILEKLKTEFLVAFLLASLQSFPQKQFNVLNWKTDVTLKISCLPIEINAEGICGLPALYAALCRNSISQLNLYHSIKSFREILEKPTEKDWYSIIIPGVLKFYDIPDLERLIGNQKVKFID